ncbi:hypothetical protein Q5530_09410 [Saccharothrix sp. BKS2]|uniref:hypothetical protein n=1 Tax=Saccharothrix sp. BKS2 TaxID=3064400 RepID=UPI0039E978FF
MDLPDWVQAVVLDEVGGEGEWNALVDSGEVYGVVGPNRSYSVRGFLASLRKRVGRGPSGSCPDCRGSLAVFDVDGSLTGRAGTAVWCSCAAGEVEVPGPRRANTGYRLEEVNPRNGRTYAESLWEELPGELCDSLTCVDGWTPWGWDASVRERRSLRAVA